MYHQIKARRHNPTACGQDAFNLYHWGLENGTGYQFKNGLICPAWCVTVHCEHVCQWHKAGRGSWQTNWGHCHPEGPGQAGQWATRNLMQFYKGKRHIPCLGRNNPSTSTGWEAAPQRRTWGSWGTSKPWGRNVPLQQSRPASSGAAWGRASWREVIPPLPSALVRRSWRAQSSAVFPSTRYRLTGVSPEKGYKEDARAWRIWHEERLQELGAFSLEKGSSEGSSPCV